MIIIGVELEACVKIAYFTDTFSPEVNGVANTLTKLSSYLERKRIRHAFFAPDYDGKGGSTIREGKRIHRFPGIRVRISPNSCLAFPRTRDIFDLCDDFAPDLVHVTTELGIGYKGMKYALSRKLPLLMSYHTNYCNYLDYFHLSSLKTMADGYLKWFYGFSQKILAPSVHTLEQLAEKGYQNLGIWSRGIEADKFNPGFRSAEIRQELGIGAQFAFLYVGRLSPEKGLDTLLSAIEKINASYPGRTAFVFTGDGPYAETIRRSGFDNVVLTGFQTGRELSRIYASCDCFAFPSGTETFGNAPLEALASGLPVVGVHSGGVTEFLKHGENALLCADGDGEAFAENLCRVMLDRKLHSSLAEKGRQTALSRNWDRIFDGLLAEYREILQTAWVHAS